MSRLGEWLRERIDRGWTAWSGFWFAPRDAAMLGVIRILAGLMLLYTHGVWALDLEGFLAPEGRLSSEHVRLFHAQEFTGQANPYAWSHLFWIDSVGGLWAAHLAAMAVLVLFTCGLWTRVTSVLAFLITVSYSHRLAPAQFGLDQINAMLAMYLMVGPSGQCFSLDAWLRKRRDPLAARRPTMMANVATRLMQIHLCVIYLFAGSGKLLGPTWWEGTALWGAIANQEYQTVDLTWLADHVWVVNLLTQVTVAWELAYCFLIWRPVLRPWMLALAVPLHAGIGFCMGMMTFGLVMLVANLVFVEPAWVRRLLDGWREPAERPRERQEEPNFVRPGRAVHETNRR